METARSSYEVNKKKQTALSIEKIAEGDMPAVRECLDKYGDIVWNLALEYTGSYHEAETITLEIFQEIRETCDSFKKKDTGEFMFILAIARQKIMKNGRYTAINK